MAYPAKEKIRVMVVNDSFHTKTILGNLVLSNPKMELAAVARDGIDALNKISDVRPDVVVLDLEMPNMDGLTFIDRIMASTPLPIIVCSSYGSEADERGNEIVFESLDAGAVDFVPLSPRLLKADGDESRQFLERIERAANLALRKDAWNQKLFGSHNGGKNPAIKAGTKPQLASDRSTKILDKRNSTEKAVVIGASTGGPRVLTKIFSKLPADLPAVLLVVQHMPAGFTKSFARHLDLISKVEVTEATDGQELSAGKAIVAPGDYHMLVTNLRRVTLAKSEKRHGVRPSINMTMIAASDVYSSGTVGVLLTGMGEDGAFGLSIIKRRGGKTMAQDESSSIVYGMAKAACSLKAVDEMVPAEEIAERIVKAVAEA